MTHHTHGIDVVRILHIHHTSRDGVIGTSIPWGVVYDPLARNYRCHRPFMDELHADRVDSICMLFPYQPNFL